MADELEDTGVSGRPVHTEQTPPWNSACGKKGLAEGQRAAHEIDVPTARKGPDPCAVCPSDAGFLNRPLSRGRAENANGAADRATAHRGSHLESGAERLPAYVLGELIEAIPGRLSFTVHESDEHSISEIKTHRRRFYFSSDLQDCYVSFCNDFGPVSVAVLHDYCKLVETHMKDPRLESRHIVFYCGNTKEERSNAAFLFAAYLVICHKVDPEKAAGFFEGRPGLQITPFCDATFHQPGFTLSLRDVLKGFAVGSSLGWYSPQTFNSREYAFFDDPRRDMNEVVPGKFVAFRGPDAKDAYRMGIGEVARLLKKKGVSVVVRLNESTTYDPSVFTDAGLEHSECFFDDCTVPSAALIKQFLDICDEAQGLIAIHCFAGIGRTGTLIALWMMRTHKFSAREAIAWLRLMRPGSVIGVQQNFLELCEQAEWAPGNVIKNVPSPEGMRAGRGSKRRHCGSAIPDTRYGNEQYAQETSQQVAEGLERRLLRKLAMFDRQS